MHKPPSASKAPSILLHTASELHKQSKITDIVEGCRKHVRGREDDHGIAKVGCSFRGGQGFAGWSGGSERTLLLVLFLVVGLYKLRLERAPDEG